MKIHVLLRCLQSFAHAAFQTSPRAASTPIAMSANMKATPWWLMIGWPMVCFSILAVSHQKSHQNSLTCLSWAYLVASSRALWARPTAAADTRGRVISNAFIATIMSVVNIIVHRLKERTGIFYFWTLLLEIPIRSLRGRQHLGTWPSLYQKLVVLKVV